MGGVMYEWRAKELVVVFANYDSNVLTLNV